MNKSKKKWIALIVAVGAMFNGIAQDSYCKEYDVVSEFDSKSAIYDLEYNNNGKLYAAGKILGLTNGNSDFCLSVINPVNGNLDVVQQFDSGYDDRAFSCVSTSDGGVIAVGYSGQKFTESERIETGQPLTSGNSSFTMLKLKADGSLDWEKHLDIGKFDDMAFSIMERNNGTFLVLGKGHSTEVGGTNKFLTIVNISLSGAILSINTYDKTFSTGEELFGVDILEVANGNIYVLAVDGYGSSEVNDVYESKGIGKKIILLKLNATLNFVFAREIDFLWNENPINVGLMAYDLTESDDHQLAIIGHVVTNFPPLGLHADSFILELDLAGNTIGNNFFKIAGEPSTVAISFQEISDGYLITGTTSKESFLHYVNYDLVSGYASVFDRAASTDSYTLINKRDFVVLGGTDKSGSNATMSIHKKHYPALNCCEIETSVTHLASITVLNTPVDFLKKMPEPNNELLFSPVDFTYTEIVNCPIIVPLLSTDEFDNTDLFNVFPNPATNKINISVTDFELGDKLEIYSADGKIMITKNIESLHTEFDLENLSNGIYIITLIKQDKAYRQKFIIE